MNKLNGQFVQLMVSFLEGGVGMNKTDLINAVAEKSELSKKDATQAVDSVDRKSVV